MSRVNKLEYISDLYKKAYWCKATLDKPSQCFKEHSKDIAAEQYKIFMEETVKNLVAATIAMRDVLREHPLQYPGDSFQNIAVLEKQPEIDVLIKQVEQIRLSNSKTASIRHDILATDRINMHIVTPKLRGFEKFCKKLKFIF